MAPEIVRIGCATQNFRKGRQGLRPKAIVIHIIVGSQKSADNSFRNPAHGTSAHFSVGKTGEIHQYVDTEDTAFHAGIVELPTWRGLERDSNGRVINPNLYTIGIEHEGKPDEPWTDEMYASSAWLVRTLAERYDIPLDRNHVIPHREIRGTKTCPGSQVDLDLIIATAKAVSLADLPHDERPRATIEVMTISMANLRVGNPSTSAPVMRTIPLGTTLRMAQIERSGEPVRGNPVWYRDRDGNFLWAGTTNVPEPK